MKKRKSGASAKAEKVARKDPDEALNGEESEDREDDEGVKADPYLLQEADYLQKETRWRNKQRTLVLCSRGTTSQFRHVMEDLRKLMPHCKAESKFEKSSSFRDLAEVCEERSCNNCIYFESRKKKDLYMWITRVPMGPSVKFQVLNIHTLGEIRYSGNCLLGSRPMLTFDPAFDKNPHLTVMKELLMQAFGTPRNHPKAKPFVDHVISFFYTDRKIFFRHYQVAPYTEADLDDPDKQNLTEIGPRFVLEPIRMLAGAWSGECIWASENYLSPTALRSSLKAAMGRKYSVRVSSKTGREDWEEEQQMDDDELLDVFK
jgi:ribosome biogenesis protein BRX1